MPSLTETDSGAGDQESRRFAKYFGTCLRARRVIIKSRRQINEGVIASEFPAMRNSSCRVSAVLWPSLAEKVEQRLVKPRRRLDLRGVAEVRKLDQLRAGNARCRRLAEHGIIAERGADGGRRQILAKRGGVFVA